MRKARHFYIGADNSNFIEIKQKNVVFDLCLFTKEKAFLEFFHSLLTIFMNYWDRGKFWTKFGQISST